MTGLLSVAIMSHPSQGAGVEIWLILLYAGELFCRTPHRVRELKYGIASQSEKLVESHPSQGAGVEIVGRRSFHEKAYDVAPLTGCGS